VKKLEQNEKESREKDEKKKPLVKIIKGRVGEELHAHPLEKR
jgi:hypothetical protein